MKRVLGSIIPVFVILGLTGCDSGPKQGNCAVSIYPLEFSSITDDYDYCATQAECAEYCAALEGRPDLASCGWEDNEYACFDTLPETPPGPPTVCAIYQTIDCGSGGTTEGVCDYTCSIQPGSSDYDPSTDCLTSYGTEHPSASTCDEAIGMLP